MEVGVSQKKKKKKEEQKRSGARGTDQNCQRRSSSPQHSQQNIGLLKRGLLILVGLSLRLHSRIWGWWRCSWHPMLACPREGLGPAPRRHCQHVPSLQRTGPVCQRFCSAINRWTTQRWRGRAHRIELPECSTEAYASEPCECSRCGVKACRLRQKEPLEMHCLCVAARSPCRSRRHQPCKLHAASLSGASVDSAAQ